jgi:tyrosinase
MNDQNPARRDFLKKSLALTALTLTPPFVFESMSQPQKIVVRKNIATLSDTDPDLVAYKDAVTKMVALPASDQRSWQAQAQIHQNNCPHGNWFFLPWHRAYLYYFEAICRELSGKKDFALPYWNWSSSPSIPPQYWGATNPLNHARRADATSVAQSEFIGQPVIDNILTINDFETFASGRATTQRERSTYGELEATPHNYVHGFVGRDMGTFMSPLDPIFWCHHANIDRIWAEWNENGHANSTENDWLNFEFSEFSGKPKKIKIRKLLSTYALGYRYDTQQQKATPQTINSRFILANNNRFEKITNKIAELNKPLDVAIQVSDEFITAAKTLAKQNQDNPKVLKNETNLIIDDISIPETESVCVRVFINCDYLTRETPITDPHYVGTFTFFATDHGNAGHGGHGSEQNKLTYKFRLTDTLTNLLEENIFPTDKITAQLLTLPLFGETSEPRLLTSNCKVELLKTT